jgi:hypothetical protein
LKKGFVAKSKVAGHNNSADRWYLLTAIAINFTKDVCLEEFLETRIFISTSDFVTL